MRTYQVSAYFMDVPCPVAEQRTTERAGSPQVATYRALRHFVTLRGIKGRRLKTIKIVVSRLD
jgi:hypothetical protein